MLEKKSSFLKIGEDAHQDKESTKAEKQRKKREKFLEIVTEGKGEEHLPAALFIMTGAIKESQRKNEDCRSVTYGDTEVQGYDKYFGMIMAGRDRVIAAAELGKTFPGMTLVAMSNIDRRRRSDASIVADELKKRGIPEEQMLLEENSVSTFTELVEMVKLAVKNNWSKIAIVSTGFHIPRIRKMMDNLESIMSYNDPEFFEAIKVFRDKNINVYFISADDVLASVSSHYKKLIAEVRQKPGYANMLESEQRGMHAIAEGTYKVANHFVRSYEHDGNAE